ncbi:lytic transglycosylase domain-containing protein [Bradyrhizobium sp. WD16]|uniref:lytic transglycosylase domain-containing protein n=1 Tax=Bradyrhizobium sp. WD16 TaxID=1521768 RepID=UPI00353203BF
MSLSPADKPASRKKRVGRSWSAFLRAARRWRGIRWARRKLATVPAAVRIAFVAATLLTAVPLANVVYQVVRKPTELFFFFGHALDKSPSETWQQYGPLFRKYSTDTITPELLAALAQIESTGNPVARTYWRWRLTWNPFGVYKPASSAVGLYQMTDPAYAEASRYCVRGHIVADADCWFNTLYIRALPSHAVELAAVYLDRGVAAVLARAPAPDTTASPQQKQDLAALIHLCGAGPARAFVRRRFQVMAGERCGDHLVTAYLAKVNAMKRQFSRIAVKKQD